DARWEPRRRSRQRSELNAYAMGGSIVRTRRSRGSDVSLSEASDGSHSRGSPARSVGGGDADGEAEAEAGAEGDETIEACGVVGNGLGPRAMPRIVSRKSQSRFDVTLTAILDAAADTAQAECRQRSGSSPPNESAQDRFVSEELSAHSRAISSYETLLICSAGTVKGEAAVAATAGLVEAVVPRATAPLSGVTQSALDKLVDEEAGPSESVLVGAAAWQRDDRRRVLRALHRLGADFAQVASLMPSKSMAQCRYFYYHYRTPSGALISEVIPNSLIASNSSALLAGSGAPAGTSIGALVLPPLRARARGQAGADGDGAGGGNDVDNNDDGCGSEGDSGGNNDADDDDDETPLATQLGFAQAAPRALEAVVLPVQVSAEGPVPRPALGPAQGPQAPPPMTAKKSGYSSYWSVHERSAFIHYAARLGQDWVAVAEAMGSKTGTQVRNYFRAHRERLRLDGVVSEYERNRAAGTLPPMTPFQPAPASLQPASPAAAVAPSETPGDSAALVRKERRGRKRKNDMSRSSAEPLHGDGDGDGDGYACAYAYAAAPAPPKRPAAGASALSAGAGPLGPMPSTAPASIASFPTMGVDGGRAVVFARPTLPPAVQHPLPPASLHPLPPASLHPLPPASLHPLPPAPTRPPAGWAPQYQAPVRHHAMSMSYVLPRAGSGTPSTQPTPPPLEGLPRFSLSSSPAPAFVSTQQRHYSFAHHMRPAEARGDAPEQMETDPEPEPESRKVSVTKINALLNDDSPPATRAELSADWFGGGPEGDEAGEDDATGIAALALASMMGAAATANKSPPQPRAVLPPAAAVVVAHPRPHLPTALRHGRPSDPPLPPPLPHAHTHTHTHMPPHSVSAMSAFSPVPVRRSPLPPLMSSPPPQHVRHSRPSSVGPSLSSAYHHRHQSPAVPPRALAISPVAGAGVGGGSASSVSLMGQRKPSAPPPPAHVLMPLPAASAGPSSGYMGRTSSSVSGYPPHYSHHQPPHYQQQQQQQQFSGVADHRRASQLSISRAAGSSSGALPPAAYPHPPPSDSPLSFGPRYADSPHYQQQQQQQHYGTPPLVSASVAPATSSHVQQQPYYYYPPPLSPNDQQQQQQQQQQQHHYPPQQM
ncbi:DNA-binding protein snt1, partial [Coemansia thaxteri]